MAFENLNAPHKTGERNVGKKAPGKIYDVWVMPCVDTEPHIPVVDEKARVSCRKCRKTWADLDMEINGERE